MGLFTVGIGEAIPYIYPEVYDHRRIINVSLFRVIYFSAKLRNFVHAMLDVFLKA